jgi:hypothetical protein
MTYYMWRNIATMMDDFHPAEFPVKFAGDEKLLFFTFQGGNNERMVGVWVDGPHQDGVTETRTDVIFPGVQVRRAEILDPMNGTEQDLNIAAGSDGTVLKGIFIKDYPVFIKINS